MNVCDTADVMQKTYLSSCLYLNQRLTEVGQGTRGA